MTTPTITDYPGTIPDKGQSQTDFDTNVDAFMTWLTASNVPEYQAFAVWAQTVADDVLAVALAGDLPSLAGKALNWSRVNAAETAVEFRTEAQVLSDIGAVPLAGGELTGSLDLSKGADVASATELLLLRDGNSVDVTGTTTITSIENTADAIGIGSHYTLQFDGILTLTHHATNLILPGGANITTAAGDIAVMYKYAAGDWRCVSYSKASGEAVVRSQSVGDAQVWQDVHGTYIKNTTYQNTNGRTITLSFYIDGGGSGNLAPRIKVSPDNIQPFVRAAGSDSTGAIETGTAIIPDGHYFIINGDTIFFLSELS
jgi:hypothetical protein